MAAPLDRLTPFQNHYCIIWIWMLDLASRLFSRLTSPTGCFDLMPLPVARGQSIQMICASLFFFCLDRLCERERMNGNDDFRVFENCEYFSKISSLKWKYIHSYFCLRMYTKYFFLLRLLNKINLLYANFFIIKIIVFNNIKLLKIVIKLTYCIN